MRRRLIAAGMALVGLSLVTVPFAVAQTDGQGGSSTLTVVLPQGTRSLTSTTNPTFVQSTGAVGSITSLTSTYTVVVDEIARSGTNPWSLTGALSGALTEVGGGTHTIPTDAFGVSLRDVAFAPSVVLGAGAQPSKDTVTPGTGSSSLGDGAGGAATVTLFKINNEDPSSQYSTVYTATGAITFTNDAYFGASYTGTFAYTLVQ